MRDLQPFPGRSHRFFPAGFILGLNIERVVREPWTFQKRPHVTLSGAGPFTLTAYHFGKKVIIDNGVNNVTVTVFTPTASYIDAWLSIVRAGTGTLKYQAPAGVTIGPSTAGGYLLSDEVRTNTELGLEIESATHYSVGGHGSYGIFKVY